MKKLASILLALGILSACSEDRSQYLKVYNWSTYIDEELIGDFEKWYEEQTGEKVTVIYQTFDILETMLSKIEKGHEDYDVVCPSDYIIERMLKQDLLLPLDTTQFGNTPNYLGSLSPFIRGYFDKICSADKNANDYAVGYMWGTTGILYNAKYVTEEEASTWDVVRNPKFAGKIFMKDSPRDVTSQFIIHLNQKELAEGKVTMDDLMLDSSDSTLCKVENYLSATRDYLAGWEADFGKEQMIKERGWVNLNWSGDSRWAILEAKEVGVDLRFTTPKEGFTIFFDGWVIPKYARNIKAANLWIDYMCRPDIAMRNSDATGYVSCCGAREILDASIDSTFAPIDASYFFGSGAESVCLDQVLYPDAKDIARSTMEHDWGEDTAKLIAMWSRVKGDSASSFTYIIIGVVLIALGVTLITGRKGKKSHRRKRKSNNK